MKKNTLKYSLLLGFTILTTIIPTSFADSPVQDAIKPLPQDGKMHVYFCGTGAPVTYMEDIRKPACLAVIVDNQFLLFDAGEGSVQTLATMGLPYTRIYNVFITHWHSDHFAGLAGVINVSWIDGRNKPINVYGPYGIKKVLDGLIQAYQFDTIFRATNSNDNLDPSLAMPVTHLIDAISGDKHVYKNHNVAVTAFEVDHEPVYPALGYSLNYKNCHVMISGDTKVIPKERKEAKNVDVFISEALNREQIQALAIQQKAAGNMTKYAIDEDIPNYHSDTLQLAQIAQQAGAKNLVLTHLDLPYVPSAKATNAFIQGMAQYYKNPIIAAKDGDELILTPNADGSCQVEYVSHNAPV
ncbi:MAG: MBL fold metallo-hydrolase [Gammaproteobacteria bacterium]|nr:MBL fold metallo-hydrolase [Gammaproteobacteria bacterium]